MNKKGVSWVLIAVVIIAVVVVGGVAYWLLSTPGEGGNGGNGGNGGEDVYTVENATSLAFKVNATIGETNELDAFTAKNLGTSEIMLRVDAVDAQGEAFVYLFDQGAETLWIEYMGTWTDYSTDFTAYWSGDNSGIIGYTAFSCYQDELAANWSGTGDHDYTDGDNTFHIYDIAINPAPADSLFEHG
jgi:hypothetical protein